MNHTGSKTVRREKRFLENCVHRMSRDMTCLVAMWSDIHPNSKREANMSWRRLKKVIAVRIDGKLRALRREAIIHSYLQAQNMAASPEEHATLHTVALVLYPEYKGLLNSLYTQFA
ncbi:hypothetical protein HO291_003407 [Salmonella enterica]|nr:hypothetical protein [Salmonella enterica]